jgi:hypothetical protein
MKIFTLLVNAIKHHVTELAELPPYPLTEEEWAEYLATTASTALMTARVAPPVEVTMPAPQLAVAVLTV